MTSQTREQRRGWLSGLLAAALFGSSAPLIGSVSHGPSPVLVAGLLYAGAALVLLPLAMAEAPTISAAWPTTVTRSRWPRALILSKQKPFSALWKVTRSIDPDSTSLGCALAWA
ncbi:MULTISPECIES: hypothetical protein [unclassified Synechococcus]|uniref:hypothetical protein n=1 Tax=unclassified Synechococcus TaxID=2626047 RepID=UPI0021A30E3C|nr:MULTISPECIES: hypothetical protein [unclassified Synechococcus]MCT0213620.1 hypothetical protein [Synechococcus sp. CS-1326]MCT0232119.1 hypothetical protein [Synechococcus sp. CS-1327]